MLTSEDSFRKNRVEAEPPYRSVAGARTQLLSPGISRRNLPVNLKEDDLKLFESELDKPIPAADLLMIENVRVNYEGVLFRRGNILPETFVSTLAVPKRRSLKDPAQVFGNALSA